MRDNGGQIMEKEKLYHIALDDYEHGVVIRLLNDEENKVDGGRQVRRCK